MPLPFGPIKPTRVPGVITRSRSLTSRRPPSDFVSPRATSNRRVRRCDDVKSIPAPAVTRRARLSASSSMSRPASLMRPLALVERALAPRRSHSISRRTVLASDS